jgi:hypothetical protein
METTLKTVASHITNGHFLRLIGHPKSNCEQIVYNACLDMRISNIEVTSDGELIIKINDKLFCQIPIEDNWILFMTCSTNLISFMIPLKRGQSSTYADSGNDEGVLKIVQTQQISNAGLAGDYG